MSFADEKLESGYLRHNMAKLAARVKVREIIPRLPCLTTHDRETIEAKRETHGNQNAVSELLACLTRRDNWPEQLIQALEACEHRSLAAEMREEYEKLKVKHPKPGSLMKTSRDPPANGRPTSQSGSRSSSSFAPSAPSVPTAASSPPVETRTRCSNPPTATASPVPPPAPPRTPETRQRPDKPGPAAVEGTGIHQQPEENSFIQTSGVVLDHVSADDSVNSRQSPQSTRPDEPEAVAPTAAPVTPPRAAKPNQSRSPAPANSNVPQEVSFHVVTPEKPPVQDTTPPVEAAAAPAPPPPTRQVSDSATDHSAATQRLSADVNTCADSVCLSKPTELCSILTPTQVHPSSSSEVGTLFSDNVSLQISNATQQTPGPVGTPALSDSGVSPSLQDEQVIVGHVSEEPTRLNMDGRSSVEPHMSRNVEMSSSSLASGADAESSASSENPPEETSHRKYFLVAACVVVCALLVAWRSKPYAR